MKPRLGIAAAAILLCTAFGGRPASAAGSDWSCWGYGRSAEAQVLVVCHRSGASPQPGHRLLVVGGIHGDEAVGGGRVVDAIQALPAVPANADVYVIRTYNPDGARRVRHGNASKVDLNRNFPASWESGTRYSTGQYFSGSAPASEPETHAFMDLAAAIEPDMTVWLHQPWRTVDCDHDRAAALCDMTSWVTGLPESFAARPGTATQWMMDSGHGQSVVLEAGSAGVSRSTARRWAAGLVTIAGIGVAQ